MRYAVYLFFLPLSGCLSFLDVPYWERTWEGAVEEPKIVLVESDPFKKHYFDADTRGWTVCNKIKRTCTIYIVKTANIPCVEAHERKHAAGWDHPKYAYSMAC